MEIADHIDALDEQGHALAGAAKEAGLDAKVPTCPRWRVRTLLGHIGGVHRWAATYVRDGQAAGPDGRLARPPRNGLLDWFVEGHAALVEALRAARPDLETWHFLAAPSPLAFWARRQGHETAIHRADAQAARAEVPVFSTEFACDGIDELLVGFLSRRRGKLVADPPRSLLVAPTDSPLRWHITILPDRRDVGTGTPAAPADCTVAGSASDLYLALWNRPPRVPIDVQGDAGVVDLWRRKAHIRWS